MQPTTYINLGLLTDFDSLVKGPIFHAVLVQKTSDYYVTRDIIFTGFTSDFIPVRLSIQLPIASSLDESRNKELHEKAFAILDEYKKKFKALGRDLVEGYITDKLFSAQMDAEIKALLK